MSKTNCVTCGHGKDPNEIKCPFCGTTYLDFTAIDFSSGDPVVLSMILPTKEKKIVQMVTIPRLDQATIEYHYDHFHFGGHSFRSEPDIELKVAFIPIPHDGKLFTVRKETQ